MPRAWARAQAQAMTETTPLAAAQATAVARLAVDTLAVDTLAVAASLEEIVLLVSFLACPQDYACLQGAVILLIHQATLCPQQFQKPPKANLLWLHVMHKFAYTTNLCIPASADQNSCINLLL